MLIQHIALVPEAEGIDPSELARVSAALQKQVTRDLSPAWGVHATVDAFPRLEDVPVGYWPILISRDLGGEGGVRLDRDGSPYAQIEHSLDWSLDASRACLEMLVNPFGKRTVSAPSPRSDQGRVEVVLEVCAPCADTLCAYAINDVVVSDFCLPAYYEEGPVAGGRRLSMNGTVSAPFRVLPGGHLTWFDVVSESYWRRSHWGENPVDSRLGKLSHSASTARELLPHSVPARLRASSPAREAFQARVDLDRQHARRISEVRAMRLRASFLEAEPEAERITEVEVTEVLAPRRSTVPPPLPLSTKPAPATVPTILREPDRASGARTAAGLALGAMAAAIAVAVAWNATRVAERPAPPAAAVTTAEAATAPPPAAPPAAAAPASVPAAQVVDAPPAASAPTAALKKRAKRPSTPPVSPLHPPDEPAPVAAPQIEHADPVAIAPAPAASAAVESASIDDLIDTRR